MLQWGHVLSDMVTLQVCAGRLQISEMLQWGHVLSDMVTGNMIYVYTQIFVLLQWGHVLSDMVTQPVGRMVKGACRFNGAMSFQTW